MNGWKKGIGRRLGRYLPDASIQIGKVFGGLFARNLVRGLFKLLLPAFLAPTAMGVLRATVSFSRILGSLIELGLPHALTVFLPPAIKRRDEGEQARILMTTAVMTGAVIAVLVIGGQLVAGRLAAWALGDPGLVVYVRLAILAAGARQIWKFFQSSLAAHQQFGRLALYLTTIPVLMLVAGVGLALAGRLTLFAAVVIQLFAPAATVLLWWPALDRGFVRRGNWSAALARQIVGFSRWVYLTNIASSLRSHLNPLLLKSPQLSGSVVAGEAAAGIYGFGNDLANELQMLSGAIVTVLVPKAARKTRPEQLRHYVRRAYGGIVLLLIPLIPLPLLAEPALRLLGRLSEGYLDYLPSLEVFTIIYVGGLFSVATLPMQAVLYAMRLPHIETRVEAAMLPVLIVGGILLIPRFGPNGAALAILVQRIFSFVVIVGYGYLKLWRWSDASPDGRPEPGPPDEPPGREDAE